MSVESPKFEEVKVSFPKGSDLNYTITIKSTSNPVVRPQKKRYTGYAKKWSGGKRYRSSRGSRGHWKGFGRGGYKPDRRYVRSVRKSHDPIIDRLKNRKEDTPIIETVPSIKKPDEKELDMEVVDHAAEEDQDFVGSDE